MGNCCWSMTCSSLSTNVGETWCWWRRDPVEYRELGRIEDAIDGVCWNTLCVYGNLLLIRSDRQMACYELPVVEGFPQLAKSGEPVEDPQDAASGSECNESAGNESAGNESAGNESAGNESEGNESEENEPEDKVGGAQSANERQDADSDADALTSDEPGGLLLP